jgi:hypothetical protein
MIARKILRWEHDKTMNVVESLLGQVRGAREGLVFEPYAHRMLSLGGEWSIRRLFKVGHADEASETTLKLGELETVDVTNENITGAAGPSLSSRGKYYIPRSSTFPVIDAWTCTALQEVWFFQMTVSETHPLKTGSHMFKALRKRGMVPKGLVFVVPSRICEGYSYQKEVKADGKTPQGATGWNDIPQYVLGL